MVGSRPILLLVTVTSALHDTFIMPVWIDFLDYNIVTSSPSLSFTFMSIVGSLHTLVFSAF
jgi:hypothetical protein